MGKLTSQERELAKSIVAMMSIKRIPDTEIIQEIKRKTNKKLSRISLYYLRQQIKKESYEWYNTLRQDQYAYIHEYKERINEIVDLQKMHHEIINSNTEPTPIKQASMNELHRLNITLSNYIEVLPTVINNNGTSISTTSEDKATTTETEESTIITV